MLLPLVFMMADTNISRLTENKSLPDPISLGASETLKIVLTTNEDKKASRPHQAFLLLREPKSNLDTSFPLSVKESGKGKVELVCPLAHHALSSR